MAKEFIVYSEKKADFEAQVASGSVDTSQIGIIAETAEFWENGNYHPLADLSGYVTKETADSVYLRLTSQSLTDAQKKQVADNLGGNATNGLARYDGGVLPVQKISASNANGLKQTYVLPNASDDVKASATGGVLATEDTIMKFSNDLTGVLEATPETFTFRPSAGDKSIRDESAVMRSIKGNTIVWNQLVSNGNFADNPNSDALPNGWINGDYYITFRATISYPIEGGIKFVFNKGNSTTQNIWTRLSSFSGIIAGHKYILSCDYYVNGVSTTSYPNNWFAIGGTKGELYRVYLKNTNGEKSRFEVIKSFTVASDNFSIQSVRGYVEGAELWIDNLTCIDLTQMFGAGNEPTTVEEFRALFPDSYYPYCEPELRSVTTKAIETVGFNQFNGEYAEVLPNNTYYLGGTYTTIGFTEEIGGTTEDITIPDNKLYTPTKKGYIYATGTNICINLSHSGVRNGEYQPYEKHTRELPEIAKYFPNGMRSAGSIYDEIRYNDATEQWEAVQRVGVRAYTSADDGDVAVITDGTNSNYELAEPIITPIEEPIQMDYWVEDFGTEEAISDTPSAPFKADVVYQFNAEGRIRDNSRNIERLEDIANEHTTAIEGKLSKPQVPPAQNSLLMWDGESMGIGDSGVGVAEQTADIANAVTDSVPTSAQVKVYISGIAGPRLSFSSNLLGVGVDETHFDVSNAQKVALNVATQGIINTAQALQKVVTLNGDKELKFPRLWLTDGLISDNGLMYALPQAGDDAIGEADAVLATESYVQTYMANTLPTEVATATPRLLALPQSNLLPANQLVDISQSTTASRITINGFAGSSSDYAYDDVWRLRFAGVSTVLSITPTIYWENGVAPNFTTWAICDLEFRKCPSDAMIGKWTIYK